MLKKRRGQSTLEYIIVFVAVVAAILIIAFRVLQPAVNDVVNASANRVSTAAGVLRGATINAHQSIGVP